MQSVIFHHMRDDNAVKIRSISVIAMTEMSQQKSVKIIQADDGILHRASSYQLISWELTI
jgi:hypothetical protein